MSVSCDKNCPVPSEATRTKVASVVSAMQKEPEKFKEYPYVLTGVSGLIENGGIIAQMRLDLYDIKSNFYFRALFWSNVISDQELVREWMKPVVRPVAGVISNLDQRVNFGPTFRLSPTMAKDPSGGLYLLLRGKREVTEHYVLLPVCDTDVFGQVVYRVGTYGGLVEQTQDGTDYDMGSWRIRVYPDGAKKFDPAQLGLQIGTTYIFTGLRHVRSKQGEGTIMSIGGFFSVVTMEVAVKTHLFSEDVVKSVLERNKESFVPTVKVAAAMKRPREEEIVDV